MEFEVIRSGVRLDDEPTSADLPGGLPAFQVMRSGVKPVEDITASESALRGGIQGATAGFRDELAGVLEGARAFALKEPVGPAYRRERDESRALDVDAKAANPLAYGGAELAAGVATSLIPFTAPIKAAQGLSLGARALRAAGQGALSGAVGGLGSSQADLTRGDVGGALIDTGVGALTGAAMGGALTYGAGKVGQAYRAVKGAAKEAVVDPLATAQTEATRKAARDALAKAQAAGPEAFDEASRKWGASVAADPAEAAAASKVAGGQAKVAEKAVVDEAFKSLMDGPKGETKLRMVGRRNEKEPGLRRVLAENPALRQAVVQSGENPSQAMKEADTLIDALSRENDVIYDAAEKTGGAVSMRDVREKLTNLWAQYAEKGTGQKFARQVEQEIADLEAAHGKDGFIPLRNLREQITDWQSRGAGGAIFNPSETKQLQTEVGWALREVLHDHIEQVGKLDPGLTDLLPKLRENNSRLSPLIDISNAMLEKSRRTSADSPSMDEHIRRVRNLFTNTKDAVSDAAVRVAEWGATQSARRGATKTARQIAAEALVEADRAAPGSVAVATEEGVEALADLIRGTQAYAGRKLPKEVADSFLQRATRAGIPLATAQTMVQRFGSPETPPDQPMVPFSPLMPAVPPFLDIESAYRAALERQRKDRQ